MHKPHPLCYSRRTISTGILIATLLGSLGCSQSAQGPTGSATGGGAQGPDAALPGSLLATKVYVAVEDDGVVAVLDGKDLHVLSKIALGDFMAHNVQVAPDGKSVWVTAVAMEMGGMPMEDELIVLDPVTDTVVQRIKLGLEVHPAHVVLTPDSKTAFVTGATKNELIRVDASTKRILERGPLGHGSGAHGARVSPDGRSVWIAEIEGKCVAKAPTAGGTIEHVMLEGQAVQTAVSADGRWVFASVYDAKKVARIDATSSAVTYAALPGDAEGPLQLYPTPDGHSVLVADQGLLGGRPASDKLYFMDIETMRFGEPIHVGQGAHGVVTFGGRAYVTGLSDGTVTAIDLATRKVVASVNVGKKPNGISAWTADKGTP